MDDPVATEYTDVLVWDFTLNYTFDRNPEAIQVLNHQDIH